jgi:hypothetical protein
MWVYWVGLFVLTPGINGASGTALRAIAAVRISKRDFHPRFITM